jgi:hypothetical protein
MRRSVISDSMIFDPSFCPPPFDPIRRQTRPLGLSDLVQLLLVLLGPVAVGHRTGVVRKQDLDLEFPPIPQQEVGVVVGVDHLCSERTGPIRALILTHRIELLGLSGLLV